MATKVVADPDTRIIEVVEAPVGGLATLDVKIDVYSALKDDWHSTASLQSLRFPFRSFGDPIAAGTQIGPYVFFDNAAGWRFQPYDSDHELTLDGNMVGEAAVIGLERALWVARAGRTIVIRDQLSAQALTLETGTSGLTPSESSALLSIEADVATNTSTLSGISASITAIEGDVATIQTDIGTLQTDMSTATKIMRNKKVTDEATGVLTVYEDNGVDVFLTADLYESTDTSQAYRGQGLQRQERLA